MATVNPPMGNMNTRVAEDPPEEEPSAKRRLTMPAEEANGGTNGHAEPAGSDSEGDDDFVPGGDGADSDGDDDLASPDGDDDPVATQDDPELAEDASGEDADGAPVVVDEAAAPVDDAPAAAVDEEDEGEEEDNDSKEDDGDEEDNDSKEDGEVGDDDEEDASDEKEEDDDDEDRDVVSYDLKVTDFIRDDEPAVATVQGRRVLQPFLGLLKNVLGVHASSSETILTLAKDLHRAVGGDVSRHTGVVLCGEAVLEAYLRLVAGPPDPRTLSRATQHHHAVWAEHVRNIGSANPAASLQIVVKMQSVGLGEQMNTIFEHLTSFAGTHARTMCEPPVAAAAVGPGTRFVRNFAVVSPPDEDAGPEIFVHLVVVEPMVGPPTNNDTDLVRQLFPDGHMKDTFLWPGRYSVHEGVTDGAPALSLGIATKKYADAIKASKPWEL